MNLITSHHHQIVIPIGFNLPPTKLWVFELIKNYLGWLGHLSGLNNFTIIL